MAILSSDFPAPSLDKQALEHGTGFTPRFGPDGLITAVATDHETGEVVMLAHMNADALAKTIETGQGWFWSRSRKTLWLKGETSGNILTVHEVRTDCDQDAIWLKVTVQGDAVACHTGAKSCFYRKVVIEDRAVRLEIDAD